ncbi:MAG: hypothetical protein AB8H03_14500 [Saprospiraceae bacterium]
MKDENDILKLIEAYLENELSDSERTDFEQRLKTDAALAKQMQLHQEVDLALSNPKSFEMETILSEIGDEFSEKYRTPKKNSFSSSRIRFIYTASIAASFILLAAFLWWQFGQSASNPQQLYAKFYEPYSISTAIRSTNQTINSKLNEGQKKYQEKNYKEAISQFDVILKNENLNTNDIPIVYFYKALSHLGLEELDEAKTMLDKIVAISDHSYLQQSQWYLALIEMKNGNSERVNFWLNKVLQTSSQGKYAKQAKELLKDLEGIK